MKPISLNPLVTQLQTFELPHNRIFDCNLVPGDDQAYRLPTLYELVRSKGFAVHMGRMSAAKMLMNTGTPNSMGYALEMFFGRRNAAGITAHSSNPQVMQHFVMFDFEGFTGNTQVAIALHEIGHVLSPLSIVAQDNWSGAVSHKVKAQMEAIAYGVEFCACDAIGLDSSLNCLVGMKHHGVSAQLLQEQEQLINSITAEVLAWLEK